MQCLDPINLRLVSFTERVFNNKVVFQDPRLQRVVIYTETGGGGGSGKGGGEVEEEDEEVVENKAGMSDSGEGGDE